MADYIDDDNLWKEDLFATLEVPHDVTDSELKKAYLKLAKKFHPDKYQDSNEKLEAQRIFSKITVAYDTLSDSQKKSHYLDLRRLLANHLPESSSSAPAPVSASQSATSAPTTNTATANSPAPEKKPPVEKPIDDHGPDKVKEEQAKSFFDIGMGQVKKKKFDDAIDSFKQAISIKPDIADYHSQLGLCYKEKNWASMAKAEFKLALKYNPKNSIAKANLSPEDMAKEKKTEEKKGGLFSGLFNFGKKK